MDHCTAETRIALCLAVLLLGLSAVACAVAWASALRVLRASREVLREFSALRDTSRSVAGAPAETAPRRG